MLYWSHLSLQSTAELELAILSIQSTQKAHPWRKIAWAQLPTILHAENEEKLPQLRNFWKGSVSSPSCTLTHESPWTSSSVPNNDLPNVLDMTAWLTCTTNRTADVNMMVCIHACIALLCADMHVCNASVPVYMRAWCLRMYVYSCALVHMSVWV